MHAEEQDVEREESAEGPPVWEGEAHSGLTRDRIYLEAEENELHASEGAVCGLCATVITANQDARKLPDGQWVHEVCPPHRPA